MSILLQIIIALVVVAAVAWGLRAAGQALTQNKPFFRDMPYAVAFGYVLGAALLLLGVWYYLQPKISETGTPVAGVTFFRWAVQGFVGFAILFDDFDGRSIRFCIEPMLQNKESAIDALMKIHFFAFGFIHTGKGAERSHNLANTLGAHFHRRDGFG